MDELLLLIFWLSMAIAASSVAEAKGFSAGWWLVLGLLVPPAALFAVAFRPADSVVLTRRRIDAGKAKVCPECSEAIRAPARLCPHCRSAQPIAKPET